VAVWPQSQGHNQPIPSPAFPGPLWARACGKTAPQLAKEGIFRLITIF